MAAERILVVDDEPSVGVAIAATLETVGYFPIIAINSTEALQWLSGGARVDLVLLDVRMKGMDGLKLLEKSKHLQPEAPVIMVTAVEEVSSVISAMKKGAYDYLLKPFENQELLATVRRALGQSAYNRQAIRQRQGLEELVEARTQMLHRAMADLERSYDITLEALGNALDLKDAETEGHSKRVTAYSIVLARGMKIDPVEVKIIARGAFLHDIGKMAIPDAILSKPGKLTPDEQSIMREHCVRGYTMLRKIPFLEKAAEIVFSHQEHFDGSGYSRGLKGLEIPLGARIFSVADAMDAITSDRPYRKARSFADARREIERCSGTQFDPTIVAVYRALPDKIWEDLRLEINQPVCDAAVDLAESLRSNR